METYKLVEDWNVFLKFLKTDLSHINKKSIGFLYRDNEIYLRCIDELTLEIIRRKYALTLCKKPDFFLDKERDWLTSGNSRLFDLLQF